MNLRSISTYSLVFALIGALSLSACGESDGPVLSTGGGEQGEQGGGEEGGGEEGGGEEGGGEEGGGEEGGGELEGCDFVGFETEVEDVGYPYGVFTYVGQDTLGAPVTTLNIEFISEDPESGDSVEFQDVGFSECDPCIMIWAECSEDLTNCATNFLATEGTINVEKGADSRDNFKGTLKDLVLKEVEVEFGSEGAESSPIEDGKTWCIPSFEFDVEIQYPLD